jgi:dihydrofolate reductase
MGKVVVDLTVSLDGFVAGADDGPDRPLGRGGERLFTWMTGGPKSNRVENRLTPPDASKVVVNEWMTDCGAIISGRRTFDIANGWKDGHPIDVPIFVVTHQTPTHGEWVVPLLLGAGVRLLDHIGPDPIPLEQTRVIESEGVTHLRYRVVREIEHDVARS